jgi:hypothetical protein
MTDLLELARRNQRRAREVIRMCGVAAAWESVGAEIHPVGSLPTGLLMTHRDIDFHIYTPRIDPADDFRAMGRLAACPAVRRVAYANLLDTPEACLEWHAWVEDADRELWQLDMIHIARGSRYDGYFERVAGRIAEVLTDDTRLTILRLKYETPPGEKIMGIEYYQAVLRDGVRTYAEFAAWRERHPVAGVIEWMP